MVVLQGTSEVCLCFVSGLSLASKKGANEVVWASRLFSEPSRGYAKSALRVPTSKSHQRCVHAEPAESLHILFLFSLASLFWKEMERNDSQKKGPQNCQIKHSAKA